MDSSHKQILIAGAGGFIGSHLVQYALDHGWAVWASVRSTTSREFLSDPRIHFIELPYSDPQELRSALLEHKTERGPWDVIINNMGVTKTNDVRDFERVNYGNVQRLVEALKLTEMLPSQFILMNSLSAWGPVHEKDNLPISLSDTPHPNTAYGLSKLHVASWMKQQDDVPWTIFYPTGVYGPREKDYYLMWKSVKAGFDFVPGFKTQHLSFVYVKDLVEAIFRSIDLGKVHREYIVAEPHTHTSSDFRRCIRQSLAKPRCLSLRVPLWLLKAVNYTAGWLAARAGHPSTLNADKYHLMAQHNWQADISVMQEELGYTPGTTLEEGVGLTTAWYKENNWI
jgi:nucleoside-diphosphate-sugar epimerase